MSEKPQKPRRTPLKRKTGTHPRPIEQPDFPAQMPPAAPPQRQNTPLPAQSQPEKVVIVQQVQGDNNSGTGVLNIITWPFRKLAGAILWLIRTIIAAMIQSVISFIMWTLILTLMSIFVGTYGFAMIETNMDAAQSLVLTFERIMTFVVTLGGLRETAESIQSALPTMSL